jgi:hypothetical protein
MRRASLILMTLCSTWLWADGWTLRAGIASFPEQNTLFGLEVTRTFDLTQEIDLGVGAVLRTDFSQTLGPALVARLRYWVEEHIGIGASAEYGYMYNSSFSSPNSYSYFLVGPLLALRVKPIFVQWEPAALLYQGTSAFVPLRLSFGFYL